MVLNIPNPQIDMETPKIKSVEETSQELGHAIIAAIKDFKESGRGTLWLDDIIIKFLTQDRASLHTSLVAAVEDIKDHSKRCSAGNYRDGMLSVCDQVLTIINSIFKE